MKIEDFTLDDDFGLVILASIIFAYTTLNPEANKPAVTFGAFACIPFKLLRVDKKVIIPKVYHNVWLIINIDLVKIVKVDLRLILKSRLIIQTLFVIALLPDSFNNFYQLLIISTRFIMLEYYLKDFDIKHEDAKVFKILKC